MDVIAGHVLAALAHKDPSPSHRPLFVGLQGPQGSGKSYLSARLKAHLAASPHRLNVALLSIDDLYLPHSGLAALAAQYPHNALWSGRGQPGTHDVALGVRLLRALESHSESIELPRFDKSLFNGEGDRLPMGLDDGIVVQPMADVVILEGWCVGFYPIAQAELDRRWDDVWHEEEAKLSLAGAVGKLEIEHINQKLVDYVELWSFFDIFVQIKPTPSQIFPSQYSIIYQWRLEQEHNMKASNGGRGMSDEAVKRFVDRYIPGYVFFGDIPSCPPSRSRWIEKSLRLLIDEERNVIGIENF